MNSPAVWHVYLALAGYVLDRPRQQITLRPRLLPGMAEMDVPVFVPGNRGRLRVREARGQRTIEISFERPESLRAISVEAGGATTPTIRSGPGESPGHVVEYEGEGDARLATIRFAVATEIGAAGVMIHVS